MIDVDARGRHEAELLHEEAARAADTETALQSVLDGDVLVSARRSPPDSAPSDGHPRSGVAPSASPGPGRRRGRCRRRGSDRLAAEQSTQGRPDGGHCCHIIDRTGGATARPADRVPAGAVPVVGRITGGHPCRLRPSSEDAHLVRRRAARGAGHRRPRRRAGPAGGHRAERRRLPGGRIACHAVVGTRGDRADGRRGISRIQRESRRRTRGLRPPRAFLLERM